MKTLLILLLSMTFTVQSQANTCRDLYQSDVWDQVTMQDVGEGYIYGSGIAGMAAGGVAGCYIGSLFAGFGLGIMIGAPILLYSGLGSVKGVIALHNLKPNKMIRLIDQAEFYAENQGTPGKTLLKLWKKLDQKYTLKELSDHIAKGNQDLSLCTMDHVSFNYLKKMIRQGQVQVSSK